MGKGLQKIFSMAVKDISQELTPLGESGSEVSHFIPEPRNFSEVNVFRVSFSQGFFMFSDNFVTSEKFLGSVIKWETSKPDSPKGVNSC